MPFIPMNLKDIPESRPVPVGRYDLTIMACEETKTREKQKPQYRISIAIEGHDNAPNCTHFIGLPDGEDAKADQFKGLLLRRFCELFDIGLNPEGFDTTQLAMEMVGAKANAELQLDETGDYNRLIVPKVKGEPNRVQAAGRPAPKPPKR